MIGVGGLVTNINVPKILHDYLDEARKCYAFQQYNAVNALSRTILEIAMRDICIRKGLIEDIADPEKSYKKYPPSKLIDYVSTGNRNKNIRKLYYNRLSTLIHGYRSLSNENIGIELRDTMKTIEELYEYHNIKV